MGKALSPIKLMGKASSPISPIKLMEKASSPTKFNLSWTNEKAYVQASSFIFYFFILYTLLIPFGKFVFVTQRNCVATEQRH